MRRPLHPFRRRLWLAAGILIVVLGAEVGARGVAPYLPPPARYGDAATAVKVAQLDRGEASNRCTPVVVVGNSMARDAIDPTIVSGELPGSPATYNAALDAANPALLRRWLSDEVLPRARPRLVVAAVSSLDLNGASKAGTAALTAYNGAPATAAGTIGRLGSWFDSRSVFMQHRRTLADATIWAPTLEHLRTGTPTAAPDEDRLATVIGPDGAGRSRRRSSYVPQNSAVRAFVQQQLLNDFTIDATTTESLIDLVQSIQAHDDTAVVLVALPVTDEFIGLHPRGAADFDEYLAVMRRVATATSVPFVDLHAGALPAHFADTHHLNGVGATALSTALAARLRDPGVALTEANVTCRGR